MLKKTAEPKVLYITYLGILEPIPQSQALPYLFKLSETATIHLLSFEKKELLREKHREAIELKASFSNCTLRWHRLRYHKYPKVISSFFDILLGVSVSIYLVIRYNINIIHARSNIPIAIAYCLRWLLPVKVLYDRRGTMGDDHVEHSGWKTGGILHRLAKSFEKIAIAKSDALVVLTKRAHGCLRREMAFIAKRSPLIETIPCCINMELFTCSLNSRIRETLGLSDKLVLVYSGSVGTYNVLSEMFDFFVEALQLAPHAHFLVLTQNKDIVTRYLSEKSSIDKGKFTIISSTQKDIPLYLCAGDLGLVLRKASSTAIAASPTKFGEYLACGLPVIASAGIGDMDEIINTHRIGVILKAYNRQCYKEAMEKILILMQNDGQLRQRCRSTAEKVYALDKGVNVYRHIYQSLHTSFS